MVKVDLNTRDLLYTVPGKLQLQTDSRSLHPADSMCGNQSCQVSDTRAALDAPQLVPALFNRTLIFTSHVENLQLLKLT